MKNVAAQFRKFARLDRKRASEGLTPRELRRWLELKRALSRQFSSAVSDQRSDQRTSLRVPTRLGVSFQTVGELQRCFMTNLSRGGLFIQTSHMAEIGAQLLLRIEIRETGEVIEVPAEVVCHNLGPGFAAGKQGMGLRFGTMAPEVEQKLGKLYELALEAAGGSGR